MFSDNNEQPVTALQLGEGPRYRRRIRCHKILLQHVAQGHLASSCTKSAPRHPKLVHRSFSSTFGDFFHSFLFYGHEPGPCGSHAQVKCEKNKGKRPNYRHCNYTRKEVSQREASEMQVFRKLAEVSIPKQSRTFRQIVMEHAGQRCTVVKRLQDSVVVAFGIPTASVNLPRAVAFPISALCSQGYRFRSEQ